MVPSGLVHLQKENNCEGKHPREWLLKEELGQGTGLGGQMGPWGGEGRKVTSGPEGQCWRR